ncbi:MAG TPA: hypothetical protein GX512_04030 [Firmicutes bacterium]|nr:hypothetical protein [Candidatus Fermentithermobacillaceae bacterium]
MKKAFSKALSRVVLPEILLPSLLLDGGYRVLGAIVGASISRRYLEASVPRSALAGEALLVALFVVLAGPAIVSGMYAVSRVVVMQGRGKLSDFWSGLGTYWWRLVGLGLLASLAMTVVVLGLGLGTGTYSFDQIPPMEMLLKLQAGAVIFIAVYVFARYLMAPVIPAMVIEQVPAMKSIELGAKFAWRNPGILVPAVAADLAVSWVLQQVNSATTKVLDYQFALTVGRLLPNLMVTLLIAVVSAFFRLLYLGIYYDNLPLPVGVITPDCSAATGAFSDAIDVSVSQETGGSEETEAPEEVGAPGEAGEPQQAEDPERKEVAGQPEEKKEPGEPEEE